MMRFSLIISILAVAMFFPQVRIPGPGGRVTIPPATGCPTGADYLNSTTNSLVTLASLGVTGPCFYVAASGSDSNTGTDKAHPWAHVPGMPNCTATCAATTPTASMGFIFKGGDTWHFGNSALAPYVGGTWTWTRSGASGSPIYLGVDPTWFSGGAWARPKFNGDNPLSTSAVASCPYQIGGSNAFLSTPVVHYVTWDNFEWLGKCDSTPSTFARNLYIYDQSTQYVLWEHNYFHGWTHIPFGGGFTYNSNVYTGGTGSGAQTGTQYLYMVIDGSDSDPAGTGAMYDGGNIVAYSVFNKGSQILLSAMHLFHDNLIMNWVDPGDGIAHGNVYHDVGEVSVAAAYNNVWLNLYNTGIVGVCFWVTPPVGGSVYVFNSLWANANCDGNFINIGQNSVDQGTFYLFNNTMESPTNGPIVTSNPAASFSKISFLTNNHYITDAASAYLGVTQTTITTDLKMTHSTATAQGYTSAPPFAFAPTSPSGGTVGTGTNATAGNCGALTVAAGSDPTLADAAAACRRDTRYGCVYNTGNHTVSCPARTTLARPASAAWDIGAYQQY